MQSNPRSRRTIAGRPPSPEQLERFGVLGQFPATPADFRPDGNWVNTYRLVTCHGYVESGNENRGFLRIERIGGAESCRLVVAQRIVQDGGSVHQIQAQIRCKNDPLSSPVEWTLSSRFFLLDGEEISALGLDEEGRLRGGEIFIRSRGNTRRRQASRALSAEWCMLDAVQRMAFEKTATRFDMLEGLSLLRSGQRIAYQGPYTTKSGGPNVPTRRFRRIGTGVLPYEYWLDEKRRLLMAASFAGAYILDDHAEEAARKVEEQEREAERRRKARRRKARG